MISFVIPAYNAELSIQKCLDSIFSQSNQDFEVIVINDGSTDNTENILDSYLMKYDNLIVKTIKNQGHGNARNYGVCLATHDYIWFVDADDYLYDNNSIERIVEHLLKYKPDIHIFSALETDHGSKNKVWNFTKNELLLKNGKGIRKLAFIQQWSWNKIIKKDFLINSGVTFNSMRMFEDIYFMIELYQKANLIHITKDVNYVYVKHDDALTSSKRNFIMYPKALLRELYFFISKS